MSSSGYSSRPLADPLSDEARERELCDLSLHAPPPVYHTPPEFPQSPRAHCRVSMDYFDPEGVHSLSRTLSNPSGQRTDSASRQPLDTEKERGVPHTTPPVQTDSAQRPPLAKACSRISVDYFDPEGVRSLSRSLSGRSGARDHPPSFNDQSLRTSEATTARDTSDDPFDFEKIVRNYLKKYVLYICIILHSFSKPCAESMKLKSRRVPLELHFKISQ